jgi:hypothetical protein
VSLEMTWIVIQLWRGMVHGVFVFHSEKLAQERLNDCIAATSGLDDYSNLMKARCFEDEPVLRDGS